MAVSEGEQLSPQELDQQALIRTTTRELVRFLEDHLSRIDPGFWQKHVIGQLSFQQQRLVRERGIQRLQQLDLAALLRVLDQNWYELSLKLPLPREGRGWVKELQTIRNKWAHATPESSTPADNYRDLDTLNRVLSMVDAGAEAIEQIQNAKEAVLHIMTETAAPPKGTAAIHQSQVTAHAEAEHGFSPGQLVALRSNPTLTGIVNAVLPGSRETRYRIFLNNSLSEYYESQLQAVQEGAYAGERLDAATLRAHITALHILSPSASHLFSLRSGRVQYVPYQYRPVLKLIRADRPRLLIADEVGVGKTIEAGLIIKELRARLDISSILVICPKALISERKWQLEMKRFGEDFTPLDGPTLRHCLRESHLEGEWPEKYNRVLLPFSLFDRALLFGEGGRRKRKQQGMLSLDPPPKFDLVIVDEAHYIRNPTYTQDAVRFFCDSAEAVLLMTATPVQMGSQDLFTLLNVLRPDIVIDEASFRNLAAPNRYINEAVRACRLAKTDWQAEARSQLEAVAQTDWGASFLAESPTFQSVYDLLGGDELDDLDRVMLTRQIEDLYTFGPMISRTRRRDIGEFTQRDPQTVAIEFTPAQRELHDDLLGIIQCILEHAHGQQNVKFMMTTIRRQAASCIFGLAPMLRELLTGQLRHLEGEDDGEGDEWKIKLTEELRQEIEGLIERASHLDPADPKVEQFIQLLREKSALSKNKSLVFSTFRHTLKYLADRVREAGLRYGLVHGGINDEDRAELRHRFALPKESSEALDVLLSSEVGSEGLDFQFCDLLINYDVPWNPMRIEQRIGRIDRYGQESEKIRIFNFITPGTVDAEIYDRCLWRIGVFHHAVGGCEEILGEATAEIGDIAASFKLTPEQREQRLQQLADNKIRDLAEQQRMEESEAELLGLRVPNQRWEQDLAAATTHWLSPQALAELVKRYLAEKLESTGEHLLGEKAEKTLRLSHEARATLLEDFKRLAKSTDLEYRQWEKWLKGREQHLGVTFEQAAGHDDPNLFYLSLLHPFIRQAAEFFRIEQPLKVSLEVQTDLLPPGQYAFALYRWEKKGVRPDEELIAVSNEPNLEAHLLHLLQEAKSVEGGPGLTDQQQDALDTRHHAKWTEARATHMEANRELVHHRIHSLTASHEARRNVLQDKLHSARDEKIRLMRESELARAEADYQRRTGELQADGEGGDVHAAQVISGITLIREA